MRDFPSAELLDAVRFETLAGDCVDDLHVVVPAPRVLFDLDVFPLESGDGPGRQNEVGGDFQVSSVTHHVPGANDASLGGGEFLVAIP